MRTVLQRHQNTLEALHMETYYEKMPYVSLLEKVCQSNHPGGIRKREMLFLFLQNMDFTGFILSKQKQ